MKYDMKQSKQLVDELVDLWVESKVRCDKIESMVKRIREEPEE